MGTRTYKGGPHRVSKKYTDFRCQKWTLWTWQGVAPRATERSANVETLPLYIAKFWSVQTCNFFSVGSRTCIISYSHFRKLHGCTLIFLYLFFGSKRREIDLIIISSEVVCLRPCPQQFLTCGHVPPHPLHTMIQQSKTIILCSICTHPDPANCNRLLHESVFTLQKLALWSFTGGGCRICHVHLGQLRGPSGAWTAFASTCHKEGFVFWTLKNKRN